MPLLDGPDTALARALHAAGAVPLEALRACLDEARARRATGATLESLLLARGLVTVEALETAATRLEVAAPAPAPGPGPARLGAYRLVRVLARGGMGAVHEAVHEPTGAVRAVKTVRHLDPEGLERFRIEVEAVGRLDHPHVGRVHEASVTPEACWLAMDLLPGGTLQDRLKAGPLPVDEALRLAIKLAGALQHAHERGVLHRDIKPQNVLFDDRGEPRLTDFGLARCVERATRLTETGAVLGTPAYMAPEQASGEDPDARTDVYALGVLLWTLLAGRAPFPSGNVFQVLHRVLTEGVPPLATARPDVPPAVARAVQRATSLRRAARHASAAELAAELQRALEPAPPPRPRVPAAAIALAGTAVAVAAVLALALAWRPRPGPSPPPTPVAHVPTSAGVATSTPAAWAQPEWLPRLERDRDGSAVRAARRALGAAGEVHPRTRAETLPVLARLDAAWTQPPLDRLDLTAYERLVELHDLWHRLDPTHRIAPEKLDDVCGAFGTTATRDPERIVPVARALVRIAPEDPRGYLLYVHGIYDRPGGDLDLDLLRAGVEAARRAAHAELDDLVHELARALAATDTPESAREQVELARQVVGGTLPTEDPIGLLLAGARHAPPDEERRFLERAEVLDVGDPRVYVGWARLHERRYGEGWDPHELEALRTAAGRALAAAEATPGRRRDATIRDAAMLLVKDETPERIAAGLERALRLGSGPEALPGLALRRVRALLDVPGHEATLQAAVDDLLRRLDGRALTQEKVRRLRRKVGDAREDREAHRALLDAALSDAATAHALDAEVRPSR